MTVDANDGIIATAGIVEGFSGAGANLITLIIAAISAMIAGTIALGGAKYAECAGDRDAELALMEEERRQLALSPEEEFAELVEHYREQGLSSDLAERVAAELTAADALGAHLRAEHGLSESDLTRPSRARRSLASVSPSGLECRWSRSCWRRSMPERWRR
jgi:VIT1/CCC1 family predicted Fe2+/Mn2+ transporter